MSTRMEEEIKCWRAKGKAALIMDNIQCKVSVAEANRSHDLPLTEIEGWVEDARKGMENALRAKPLDNLEQYEKQIWELQEAYGEAMLQIHVLKKISKPAGGRGQMMALAQQTVEKLGATISTAKLCEWFGIPRRSAYYQPRQSRNGMIECVSRTLKEKCVHRYRFETLPRAGRVIGALIGFYNTRCPQQALDM